MTSLARQLRTRIEQADVPYGPSQKQRDLWNDRRIALSEWLDANARNILAALEQPTAAEQRARAAYDEETSNHPTIHCNRFPTWDELSDASKRERIENAE